MAGQDEDVRRGQDGRNIRARAKAAEARAQGCGGAGKVGFHVLAMIRWQPVARDQEGGLDGRHGGEQFGVAFVADQPADGGDDDVVIGDAELGADAGAGGGVGAENRGIAAIADGDGVAVDVQAFGVLRFLGGDGGEDVGDAAGGEFHGERGGASWPGARLVEQESVAGIGDTWHPGLAGGHAGEEAADGHVGVNEVGFFGAEQSEQGAVGTALGGGGQAAGQRQGFDTEAFVADRGQKGAVGAGADDRVAAGACAAHEGEKEMAEGEIDVGDLNDLHAPVVSARPARTQGTVAAFAIGGRFHSHRHDRRAISIAVMMILTLAASMSAMPSRAAESHTLLIAPHISGITFCSDVVDDVRVSDEESAASICAARHRNAADRVTAVLNGIGPIHSPSGKFELGYTLNLPLLRFFTKMPSGTWELDQAAVDNMVSIIRDVDRPVVVYLSANHFTDGGIALSNELAAAPSNLMWTKAGPLKPSTYFVVALHAWTLVDPDARITALRRQAFHAVLDAICRLDSVSRQRIAAISVLGEVHQLWGNFDAGQGYNAGFDVTDYSPKAVAGFRMFLASHFSDIASLNKALGSEFKSFLDISPPSKDIRKERLNSFFEHIDAYAAGFVPVQGWAYDPSGTPVRLEIYLDGARRGAVVANLNRSDVPEADSNVPTPNVGWRFDLDYRHDVPGVHTLELFRILPDGRKVRITRRGLTVVPRDQSPALPLPVSPVVADEADPHSKALIDVDGPAPLTPLFYNPLAELWLAYRNTTVKNYISGFADIADGSCLSPEIVFSHQLLPELNPSWDADLMAVNLSQTPNASYHQGVTLYGGATWGQAFFDWEKADGMDRVRGFRNASARGFAACAIGIHVRGASAGRRPLRRAVFPVDRAQAAGEIRLWRSGSHDDCSGQSCTWIGRLLPVHFGHHDAPLNRSQARNHLER